MSAEPAQRRAATASEVWLWWIADGEPWQARLQLHPPAAPPARQTRTPGQATGGRSVARPASGASPGGRIAVSGARALRFAAAAAGEAALDLLAAPQPGIALAVLYPRAIALLPSAAGGAAGARVFRTDLPPGASARRLARGFGCSWLATDRGLLVAPDARGPWRRARAPAGRLATAALASGGAVLAAVGPGNLLRARAPAIAPARAGAASRRAADRGAASDASGQAPHRQRAQDAEPGVRAVQRMAIRHQGIDVERARALRARARRRGWWPDLDLDLAYGGDRDRRDDFDQSFVSGATRRLVDRTRDRGHDWAAGISLRFRLADGVFDPEIVDLAREERQWIGLRDDILDEVGQLYFERRRVLLALERLAAPGSVEAARLRLRADELQAGLDAWTGGGFSAALDASDRPDVPDRTERIR